MRTLTAALQAAHAAPVQRPAWLAEITLSASTLRLSSYGTVSWNGQTWNREDMDVSGLRVGALRVTGSLIFGNADDSYGAIALTEGFTDKRVRIWGYDAGALSVEADAVLLVDAVGGGSKISETRVVLSLRHAAEYRTGPRAIVSPLYGFTTMIPAGRTLTINGISFVLTRGR
jgi:hypothetical protein